MIRKSIENFLNSDKKDAFRLGLQSSIAAILTFITLKYFNINEVFVGILSAVLIVEPSIGDTIGQAKNRIFATIAGSILGFGAAYIIPDTVGKIILLALSIFIMNFISNFKKSWKYGLVATIAIALGTNGDLVDITLLRLLAISIGSGFGMLVSFIVWPSKAEKRAENYLKKALLSVSDRFELAIDNTRLEDVKSANEIIKNYHKNIQFASELKTVVKFTNVESLNKNINCTKELYNSIVILDRISGKSSDNVSNGDSNITKNIEEVKSQTSKIIKELAEDLMINKDALKQLSTKIDEIENEINLKSESQEILTLRYALLFAIKEIEVNLLNFKA